MKAAAEVQISATKELIWSTITDIANAKDFVEAILAVEVLEHGRDGLVGLKWKETRQIFGKQADETMWITDAKDFHFYQTCAKNSGAIYTSRVELIERNDSDCILKMSFSGEAQTFVAKLMSIIFTPLMRGSIQKMLQKDLEDIRTYIEAKSAA